MLYAKFDIWFERFCELCGYMFKCMYVLHSLMDVHVNVLWLHLSFIYFRVKDVHMNVLYFCECFS